MPFKSNQPLKNLLLPQNLIIFYLPRPDVSFFMEPAELSRTPALPFTMEEKQLVDNVSRTEIDSTLAIPVKPELLMSMVNAARTGQVVPYKTLVEGYTICMKRIIRYASNLDFFR